MLVVVASAASRASSRYAAFAICSRSPFEFTSAGSAQHTQHCHGKKVQNITSRTCLVFLRHCRAGVASQRGLQLRLPPNLNWLNSTLLLTPEGGMSSRTPSTPAVIVTVAGARALMRWQTRFDSY